MGLGISLLIKEEGGSSHPDVRSRGIAELQGEQEIEDCLDVLLRLGYGAAAGGGVFDLLLKRKSAHL